MPDTIRYQVTGPLLPGSALYVWRSADDQLIKGLLAGEFCYVLSARQMGKSSLLSQTVTRLREGGVMVATANLQAGTDVKSENEWYEGVIESLVDTASHNAGFVMPFQWETWWDTQRGPLGQRFVKFLREAFLVSNEKNWVIAVDEIDATITLPFTDSFFSGIRLCYDNRPGQPVFRRLTFALLGVATPTELIKDRSRTPFNIGRPIELAGFSDSEAEPLAKGLSDNAAIRNLALKQILYWTGGQPHLTQNLCEKLVREWEPFDALPDPDFVSGKVDALVSATYFHGNVFKDPHFGYIAELRIDKYHHKAALLRALAKCKAQGGCNPAEIAAEVAELKISGLVETSRDGMLRISNRIYAHVFNDDWIAARMPPANTWRNVAFASISLVATILLAWFFWLAPLLTQQEAIREDAVKVIEATVVVPRQEYQRLSTFTDQQIARSLRKAKGRPGRENYEKLPTYADQLHIADKLWADYWQTQAKSLLRPLERISALETESDVDAERVEIQNVARRLREGLTESEAIQRSIRAEADRCMSVAVSALWKPIELGNVSGNIDQKTEFLQGILSATKTRWMVLGDVLGELTPLAGSAELSERIFPRLVVEMGSERRRAQAADQEAQKFFARVIEAIGPVSTISELRSRAQLASLLKMAKNAREDVCYALAAVLCDALENPLETDSSRLSSLVSALGILVQKKHESDLEPLAERLTKALENPQEKNRFRVSNLASALGILMQEMDDKHAAVLAARGAAVLIRTLEDPKTDTLNLSSLASALGVLMQKMDDKDAAILAMRGTAILIKILENPGEESSSYSDLITAFNTLAKKMRDSDAGPLADRLTKTLENRLETKPSRLSGLASALVILVNKMEAKNAARLAARAAAVLVRKLENFTIADFNLSDLGLALAALTQKMDPGEGTLLATRGTAVLIKALADPSGGSFFGRDPALEALTRTISASDAELFAERLTVALEDPQEMDAFRRSGLASALATLLRKVEPRNAALLAARGAATLVQTLEDPKETPTFPSDLVSALDTLARKMHASDVMLLAERLSKALENPQEMKSRLPGIAWAMGILTQRMEAKDRARFVRRTMEVVTTIMEDTAREAGSRGFSSIAPALGILAQQMEPDDVVRIIKRNVSIMIPRVLTESTDVVPWITVLWAACPAAFDAAQATKITAWMTDPEIEQRKNEMAFLWLLLSLATPPPDAQRYAAQGTNILIQLSRDEPASQISWLIEWRRDFPAIVGEKSMRAVTSTLIQNLEQAAASSPSDRDLIVKIIGELRTFMSTDLQ